MKPTKSTRPSVFMADGQTKNGKFVVVYSDDIIRLYLLKISLTLPSVRLELVEEIFLENLQLDGFRPKNAAVIDQTVFIRGAERNDQSNSLISINT